MTDKAKRTPRELPVGLAVEKLRAIDAAVEDEADERLAAAEQKIEEWATARKAELRERVLGKVHESARELVARLADEKGEPALPDDVVTEAASAPDTPPDDTPAGARPLTPEREARLRELGGKGRG